MRRFYFVMLFSFFVLCTVFTQDISIGQFSKQSFYSRQLGKDWLYSLYLPPDYYSKPDQRFPVIYLLHGMTNNYNSFSKNNLDQLFNKLIDKGMLPQTIFVAPQGFGYSWWVNSSVYGNMEDAIIKDLIPMVEQTYRIDKSRGKKAISGISMGGYGALRLALLYPQLFHSVILLSPAVFYPLPGNEVIYSGSNPHGWYYTWVVGKTRNKGVFGHPFNPMYYLSLNYRRLFPGYLKKNIPVKFYVAYGDKDNITDNATKNMIAYFRAHRYPIEIMKVPGAHNWSTWKKAYAQVLNSSIFAQDFSN